MAAEYVMMNHVLIYIKQSLVQLAEIRRRATGWADENGAFLEMESAVTAIGRGGGSALVACSFSSNVHHRMRSLVIRAPVTAILWRI